MPIRIAAILLGIQTLAAGPASFSEYEVKSAMLVNFTRFVDWPPSLFSKPGQPLVIGVLGPDPFGQALDEVAREKIVNGRAIQVRRFDSWPPPEPVHVLFVGKIERRKMKGLFGSLGGQTILTVSDSDGFAGQGGMIGLTIEEGKVKFEVNLEAAERGGLKLSSKLLRLAARTWPAAGRVE